MLSRIRKVNIFILFVSRIFLAKVREGSLQPYSRKDEKSEPSSGEDVKNDDVKENSENELEKDKIKDEL